MSFTVVDRLLASSKAGEEVAREVSLRSSNKSLVIDPL